MSREEIEIAKLKDAWVTCVCKKNEMEMVYFYSWNNLNGILKYFNGEKEKDLNIWEDSWELVWIVTRAVFLRYNFKEIYF